MAEVVNFRATHMREHEGIAYVIAQTQNTWRWSFVLGDLMKKDVPTKIYGYANSIVEAEAKCRKRIDTLLDTYQKQREVIDG